MEAVFIPVMLTYSQIFLGKRYLNITEPLVQSQLIVILYFIFNLSRVTQHDYPNYSH